MVKDGAIPPGGRQVRCASCKHSWHQDPDENAEPEPAEPEVAEESPEETENLPETDYFAAGDEEETLAEATLIEPRSGPEAEERAYEEATLDTEMEQAPVAEAPLAEPEPVRESEAAVESDWREPPEPEAQPDDFRPYAAADEVAPKRRSPVLTVLIVVIVVVAIAAAFWFLAPPDLKAKLGLAEIGTSPLALVTTHMDRQRLESGNELLTVTGRVINPTSKSQPVPPLQAQLKTKAGKIVYSWTIAPPVPSLAPGESKSFNSAEVSVPPGGDELTITIGTQAG